MSLSVARQARAAAISVYDEAGRVLFSAHGAGERGRPHSFVDGLLLSPSRKDYRVAPPEEVADQLRTWLDNGIFSA